MYIITVKIKKTANIKSCGTRGYLYIAGERVKWYNHFGKHFGSNFLLIFVIAKTWKQLKYTLTRWWIQIIFIHKTEH